jgi:FKBP-type peptidyl-prolyl cis-trans isomerase
MTKTIRSIMTLAAISLMATNLTAQTPAGGAQSAPPAKSATTAKPTQSGAAAGGAAGSAKAGAKTATGAKRDATAAAPLKTDKQKASYAIGLNIGNGLKNDDVDIDTASLARGLKDAMAGTKPAITPEDAQKSLTALATATRAKQALKLEALSAPNRKAGAEFLAANKSKDGVVALPDGLQYKVLTAGTGPKPALTDEVVCNYRGTLLDGKEFDSSYKRGQPVTFPLNRVIKGWSEALQLMPVGSKWQLFVPADLAYGNEAKGDVIPGGSTLVFEVELLSIAPKPEPAKTEAPKADGEKSDPAKADAPKTDAPKPKPSR